MNEVANIERSVIADYIQNVENRSDSMFKRLRITFKNGYGISIIQGDFSYGGKEGLFEVAPLDMDGEIEHEEVEGRLTEEEVFNISLRIAKY